MKSALSLTLIVCLVGSSLPAAAQEPIGSSPGPIARVIKREAIRLAAEPAADTGQQRGTPAQSNWSRVRKLQPGTEIVATVTVSSPAKRYVLAADDTGLMVLNLTDPRAACGRQGCVARHGRP